MVVTWGFGLTSLYKFAGHLKSCVWMVSLVLLFSSFAFAQRDLGTITGTVTDPSGAAVPGATITITNVGTGESATVQTTATGDYARPALATGTYTVSSEAAGFRRASEQNVVVTAGSRIGVPFVMQVGQITETVEVTGQATLVQDESTQLGANLNSQAVTSLPLGAQRTFTYLARLSPGVNPSESTRDQNTGGFSANGMRGTGQNNFLLNGVDNNVNVIDFLNGASFVIGPPPEAIGEMSVMTSGYNAEYGRAAGGVVNVNLKTGTNELHGGVWEVLQNNDLNANSWQNNNVGAPRPVYRQNQFGGAAGGPIIKNRFFIFGDYQGTRQKTPSAGFDTFPTPAELQGNFSGLLGPSIGSGANGNIAQYQVFDPASTTTVNGQLVRSPFPGNIIPTTRFDPAAAKIAAIFPAPNQPVNGFPINDYYYSAPTFMNQDSGDLRGDFRISDKGSLYGSLSWMDQASGGTAALPALGSNAGGNPSTQATFTRNGQMGYTRVWTPSIVTETRVATTRLHTSIIGVNQTTDGYKEYGIGGYDPSGALPSNGGLPGLSPSRYTGFGAGVWQPMLMYSNVRDFIQNVAIMKGSHAIKFGAELRLVQFPFVQFSDPHGDMNFSNNATAYPGAGALSGSSGDAMASFLLGIVDSGSISTTNFISSQKQTWGFYVQDDWKVTSKLTLNLGMRYELFSPTYERFGRSSNFVWQDTTLYIPQGNNSNQALPPNFASSFPNVTVSRGQVSKYMYPWDKWDFGPRFGLAYKVAPKTVIRAGFGIFYGGEENLGGSPNLGENAPFNYTVTLGRVDLNDNALPNNFVTNPWFAGGLSSGWPTNVFQAPAPVDFHGFGTDSRSPLVQKWNIAIQRELAWDTALEVAYVGNHQSHQYETDQAGGNPCPNFATTNTSITCDSLRAIPYIGVGNVTNSNAYANYNALTVKVEKRLTNGLQFISSYAWSHVMTDACLPLSNVCDSPNPLNYSSMYSNAQWDHRHSFTTGFVYELPVGKGRQFGATMNPVLNTIVGGWGLNGILTIRTGAPNILGYNGCQGVWRWCRPDVVSGQNIGSPSGGRSASEWFNTAAFTTPAPLTGGNAAPYDIYNPGNSTLDTALFKTFRMTERFSTEFRFEAFNAFNKVQLGAPDTNLQDSTFGKITTSSGERRAQFSLRLHF